MLFSDVLAAFRWWVVLLFLGFIAFPLAHSLLKGLPDRGYAFSKMLGILIASYIFWLLGTIGFIQNTIGGILLAVILLIILSIWATSWAKDPQKGKHQIVDLSAWAWLRSNWRYVLGVEILFAIAFIFWVLVRAQNPAIAATEKPMEFAFLNSASRSPTYPPLDPWLSGFAISYYYFGYIMTSVITRIAAVPEQIGFNLAIAWLAAGTSIGAFGIVYNLIQADKDSLKVRAAIFGLIAALSIPVAGNMEVLLEILHANDFGSDGLWEWMDVRDLNGPTEVAETPRYETSQWWWWRSSRVIHEYHLSGRPEEGLEPIAEFPAFSFILGDLHPHVLALPFAFLGFAFSLAWWLRPKRPIFDIKKWFQGDFQNQFRDLTSKDKSFLIFTAVILGALSFLNTWDVLIYLFLIVGTFVLAQWRVNGRWSAIILRQAISLGAILTILAILLYLPFYLGFRSQAGPPFLLPMAMRPTRLFHFMIIFTMPLISILTLIVTLLFWFVRFNRQPVQKQAWRIGLVSAAGLIVGLFLLMLILGWIIAINPEGASRVQALTDELGLRIGSISSQATLLTRIGWATNAIIRLVPVFLIARLTNPGLILLLAFLIAAVIFLLVHFLNRPTHNNSEDLIKENNILEFSDYEITGQLKVASTSLPLVLLLIGTASLLVLGPEFVYLRDNFGQRINTIFKFYYQAWLLFGLAAIYGLDYLLRRFRIRGILATIVYGAALLVALLFPLYAIQSRAVEYRGPKTSPERLGATLDGLEYLRNGNPDEYDALLWIRDHIQGVPVIVEAVGGQYSAFGRVAATTGLPTLLGWAGHEYQWRGSTPEPGQREPVVGSIYSDNSWTETANLLDRYDVDLVYFGTLERSTYDPRAGEKFNQNLDVAYQNDSVTIYRWLPEGTN